MIIATCRRMRWMLLALSAMLLLMGQTRPATRPVPLRLLDGSGEPTLLMAVVDGNGKPVLDANGNQVYMPYSPTPTGAPSAGELTGTWKSAGETVEILEQDGKVTLKGKRTWKGAYDAKSGLLTLTYEPTIAEMAPIPNIDSKLAAAIHQQAHDKHALLWKMALKASYGSTKLNDLKLEGTWDGGELKWNDNKAAATGTVVDLEVTAVPQANPRKMAYTRQGLKIDGAFEVQAPEGQFQLPPGANPGVLANPFPMASPVGPNDRVVFVYGENFPRSADVRYTLKTDSTPDVSGYEVLRLKPEFDSGTMFGVDAWKDNYWRAALKLMKAEMPAGANPPRVRDGMLVIAHLGKTFPGYKDISVNGQHAMWFLHRGTIDTALAFARMAPPVAAGVSPRAETLKSGTEVVTDVFAPETVYVEVRPEIPTPKVPNLTVVVGINDKVAVDVDGTPLKLTAYPVPGFPKLYRTMPIHLAWGTPAATAGAPASRPATGAATAPAATGPRSDYTIVVKRDDVLRAQVGPPGLLRLFPNVAEATVSRTPADVRSLWREALFRAARAYDLDAAPLADRLKGNLEMSTQDIEEFSSWVLIHPPTFMEGGGFELYKPEERSIKVKAGHLAAMILLRDTFLEMMQEQQKALPVIDSPGALEDFFAYMRPQLTASNPIGNVKVPPPKYKIDGFNNPDPRAQDIPLYMTLDDRYLEGNGLKLAGYAQGRVCHDYQVESLGIAYARYVDSVGKAIARAQRTKDGDAGALLMLTGFHFTPIVDHLLPRLMKLDESKPGRQVWVPDEVARRFVVEIEAMADEYKANKAAAEADTQLLLAMSSLLPFAPVGALGRVALSFLVNAAAAGDVLVNQLPDYFANQQEQDFAQGAAGLLGNARLNEARASERDLATMMAGLGMAGLGIAGDVWAASKLVPEAIAMARGAKIAEMVERDGIAALRGLSAEDQAAYVAYMGNQARMLDDAAAAGQALTPEMQAAAAAQARVEKSAREALAWYVAKDNAPELARFEAVAQGDPNSITREMVMDLKADPAAMRSLKTAPEDVRTQFNRVENEINSEHDREVIAYLKGEDTAANGAPAPWKNKDMKIQDFRTPGSDPNGINTDRDYRVLYKTLAPDPIEGWNQPREVWLEVPRSEWQEHSVEEFAKSSNYSEEKLRTLASSDDLKRWDNWDPADPTNKGRTLEESMKDKWAELHQQLATDKWHPEASTDFSDQTWVDTFKSQLDKPNVLGVQKGDAMLKDATRFGMMYDEKADAYLRLTSAEYPDGNKLEAMAQMKKGIDMYNDVRNGYTTLFERASQSSQLNLEQLTPEFEQASAAIKNLAPYDKTVTTNQIAAVEKQLNDLGFRGLSDFKYSLNSKFDNLKLIDPPKGPLKPPTPAPGRGG